MTGGTTKTVAPAPASSGVAASMSATSPASPSAIASPSTEPPGASPTDGSSQPHELGVGPATASQSSDGFLVEFWLDKLHVEPGDRVSALVRVTNEGNKSPMWESNTCFDGPAPIAIVGAEPLEPGKSWTGNAALFKSTVLNYLGVAPDGRPPLGKFIDASRIDIDQPAACSLMSDTKPFKPGEVEEARLAWDVGAPRGMPLDAGQMTVAARFVTDEITVVAEAGLDLTAGSPAGLTDVDYVDAALAQPDFAAWLNDRPKASWINPMLEFWPTDQGAMPNFEPYKSAMNGAVDVGLFAEDAGTGVFDVVLDPLTAEVLGTRDGSEGHGGSQPTPTPTPAR